MKHFQLQELVSKETFDAMGEDAWHLFSAEALIALDDLRDFFGLPITVNDWAEGGEFQWRGYRTPEKATALGSPNSRHRFGDAFDCDIRGVTADHARAMIIAAKNNPYLIRIQRLEEGVNWVHFDLMPVAKRIHLFHK